MPSFMILYNLFKYNALGVKNNLIKEREKFKNFILLASLSANWKICHTQKKMYLVMFSRFFPTIIIFNIIWHLDIFIQFLITNWLCRVKPKRKQSRPD
jgi:hypothetical protein